MKVKKHAALDFCEFRFAQVSAIFIEVWIAWINVVRF